MWPRFIGFSVLNWITNIILVMVLLRFAVPGTFRGFALAAVPWVVSFVLAFFFAELAFHTKLPGRRETMTLIVIWLIVGYSFHLLYALVVFQNVLVVLQSPDLHLTYVFEVAAILLAGYVIRRRKIKATLGEGMEM